MLQHLKAVPQLVEVCTNQTGCSHQQFEEQLVARRRSGVAGTIMGAAAQFNVTVKGRGGHAAMPHTTVDPVVAGASIVTALQVTQPHCLHTCVQKQSLNSMCCRNSLHAPVGQSTCNVQCICTACAQLHVIRCCWQ